VEIRENGDESKSQLRTAGFFNPIPRHMRHFRRDRTVEKEHLHTQPRASQIEKCSASDVQHEAFQQTYPQHCGQELSPRAEPPIMLILASQSQTRLAMLTAAGVPVHAQRPSFDEAVQANAGNSYLRAAKLAAGKALSVGNVGRHLVVGADQTLHCEDVLFHKAETTAEARRHLLRLRGKEHTLTSSAACVQEGKIIWAHTDQARLTMRDFSDAFLDLYLEACGSTILNAVGCYHIEGRGVQLFEKVTGDYYTILGMPLLPLLAFLRYQGILAP
jgi:septum formation protein